jgi:DNA-damage-inducible protein J
MEKTLPSGEEAPNATTVGAMEEARSGELPSFRDVRDLIADLDADD